MFRSEQEVSDKRPTCLYCGKTLRNLGYYFTCHVCGATYCYIHMRHHANAHAAAKVPGSAGNVA